MFNSWPQNQKQLIMGSATLYGLDDRRDGIIFFNPGGSIFSKFLTRLLKYMYTVVDIFILC